MSIFGKKQTYSFSEVLKGIQHAVNSAQEMLQVQQLEHVLRFWDQNSGTLVSRKVKVAGKELDVPLMALVPHDHLAMDDIEISFRTKIGAVSQLKTENALTAGGQVEHTDLQMELESIRATDNDVVDIKIRFKRKDMSEGIARLTDEINKQRYRLRLREADMKQGVVFSLHE
ncbi:MAG: DUF2589 domain-containing protein [Paludibacteraceae bacterium]|nr:DUF2589 domain-containing protein [Paludibacteraceae bacterium]MBQ9672570.1 DUF2589 domain-containing protein [Prevotella sp.]